MEHVYNEILLRHKNPKIMPFAATWTDLKIIILSEVSQRQIYVQTKKKNMQTYLQNRSRLTDIEDKLMVTKGEGRRIN